MFINRKLLSIQMNTLITDISGKDLSDTIYVLEGDLIYTDTSGWSSPDALDGCNAYFTYCGNPVPDYLVQRAKKALMARTELKREIKEKAFSDVKGIKLSLQEILLDIEEEIWNPITIKKACGKGLITEEQSESYFEKHVFYQKKYSEQIKENNKEINETQRKFIEWLKKMSCP